MSTLSKLLGVERVSRNQAFVVATSAASLAFWTYHVYKRLNQKSSSTVSRKDSCTFEPKDAKNKKPTGSPNYAKQIKDLQVILKQIAGAKEYTYAAGVAIALTLRTICDLWMMKNGTAIEASIITRDFKKLQFNMVSFVLAMPSLALVNCGLKFCLNELKLRLRTNLSNVLYSKYVSGLTYYRINVLDNSCPNVDQLLTNDVEKFSQAIVDVYSNIAKPILDIVILVQRMSLTFTGTSTPSIVIGYLLLAGQVLIYARKPLTRLTVKQTQLEGQLRYVHSRLIANCEEIAFYQGNAREKATLSGALNRLREHLFDINVFKCIIDYTENIIAKYMAITMAYTAMAVPFMGTKYASDSHAVRLEVYYESGRMVIKLMEAFGRLLLAGREFARLSAYTQRVTQLVKTIDNESQTTAVRAIQAPGLELRELVRGSGIVERCDPNNPFIQFIDVPLCTPSGDVLINSLNITIRHGEHVIITGPNGCGKSSLFRLVGELWPLYAGKLIKPAKSDLFYIPQKPYLTLGSFRDQIIYPDLPEDMERKNITDLDLASIMSKVELGYLLERESFDSIQDWSEVLSGGEKQRVAIARLVYHKPLYAILDECTSAVSVDVEQRIYSYITKEINCSLLSVSHRLKQLAHFHHSVLRFDGCGSYTYTNILEEGDAVVL